MSERYSRLFSLPENLYTVGSPVIIAAGALLKDNQTKKILAQLKFCNISDKLVETVKIRLEMLDTAGNIIGEPVLFDYLDLSASRDMEFGQKVPVPLPESKTRSYNISVEEVVFFDKTTWKAEGIPWESLPRQKTLEAIFQDTELVKQYRIAIGSNFDYFPMQEKDIWFCACGGINHEGEPCHVCRRTLEKLQTISREQLIKDKGARLAEEARKVAEAKAAMEAKAAANAEKRRKAVKVAAIVVPISVAIIAAGVFTSGIVKKNKVYKEAVTLMETGEYQKAISAFESLGEYKDSTDRISKAQIAAKYESAVRLSDCGEYEDAILIFEELGDYSDSKAQIVNAYFLHAEKMLNNGNYSAFQKDLAELWKRSTDVDRIDQLTFSYAIKLYEEESFVNAADQFRKVRSQPDSTYYIGMCHFSLSEFEKAKEAFMNISPNSQYYEKADELIRECQNAIDYDLAKTLCEREDYSEARELFAKLGDYRNSAQLVQIIETNEKTDFAGVYRSGNTYLQIRYTLDVDEASASYTAIYQDSTSETQYSRAYVNDSGELVIYDRYDKAMSDNKTVIPIDQAEYHLDKLVSGGGFFGSGYNPWATKPSSSTYISRIFFQKTSSGVTECTEETTDYYGVDRPSSEKTTRKQFQNYSV